MSNNDAMLLPASNIASGAHVDDSNENQSKIPRFSKNLDFCQFLKTTCAVHICCYEYHLSDITNWQHIGGGLCGNNLATNFRLHPPSEPNFHLWRRFFTIFDKIYNLQQQKQQMLFLSNMTPKVLPSPLMLLGDLTGSNDTLFRENTPFFGVSWSKKGPHRRFGGSKFVADF